MDIDKNKSKWYNLKRNFLSTYYDIEEGCTKFLEYVLNNKEVWKIKSDKHYAYMVRCNDNSIYSGYAVDPYKREEVHNSGKGAKYTRARLPVKLVYFEEFDDKKEALRRERELKKYSHLEKENIINKWPKTI